MLISILIAINVFVLFGLTQSQDLQSDNVRTVATLSPESRNDSTAESLAQPVARFLHGVAVIRRGVNIAPDASDVIPNLMVADVDSGGKESATAEAALIDGGLLARGKPLRTTAGKAITSETFKAIRKLMSHRVDLPRLCYQCSYSPPVPRRRYASSRYYHGYERGMSSRRGRAGGWDKCLNPFSRAEGERDGIDTWLCHSNCYIRRERSGHVFRGCYRGEFDVDPKKTGCHLQAGSIYCFCKGDRCNNGRMPS